MVHLCFFNGVKFCSTEKKNSYNLYTYISFANLNVLKVNVSISGGGFLTHHAVHTVFLWRSFCMSNTQNLQT